MPLDGTFYESDEILRVLRAAQERIRLPENWCQRTCARDSRERIVYAWSPEAVRFCAAGAFIKISKFTSVEKYMTAAALSMGFSTAPSLNDQSDHSTVMAMFERAIELRFQEMTENVLVAG